MEEKAILKNIGKKLKILFFEVGGIKRKCGKYWSNIQRLGGVKYPVGYKKHDHVGIKGRDIAVPFPPHLRFTFCLLKEINSLKEACHQDNLLKPSAPQTKEICTPLPTPKNKKIKKKKPHDLTILGRSITFCWREVKIKKIKGWNKKKINRPLFPYLATSKCNKVFVGVLFSCRSFAHLRSGQDKGLWGFSAAREHLRALSSCSSFSSSQWSQSQTSCRSQLLTHCWSGHAWDGKEERKTGIRTLWVKIVHPHCAQRINISKVRK